MDQDSVDRPLAFRPNPRSPSRKFAAATLADKSAKILIVDDDETRLRIIRIRDVMRRIGLTNVDEASDGAEAFAMLEEGEYGWW